MIRPYRDDDAAAVDELVRQAWPDDTVLRGISAVHGGDREGDRWRRTLVFERDGRVLATGTLLGSARHPLRYFVVVLVAPSARRGGIGSVLLGELVGRCDGRPLLARVREDDAAGLAFLQAHSFGALMRSRVGVVDPDDRRVRSWIAAVPPEPVENALAREELARAHEEAYAAEHAVWSPATERPLEESLRLFCGDSWLAHTARVVRRRGRIAAVGGLHGPPLAPSESELFLIAGSAMGDEAGLRAVVAAELELAQGLGARVSIEADDANRELSQILSELPAVLEPTLLLLSSDSGASPL